MPRYTFCKYSNAQGVTHFDDQGHGELTRMDQWIREHKLFHSLLKISFFARYRVWKSFSHWRRVILHSKIQLAKKALEKNLFFNHKVLRPALLKIQTDCVNLRQSSRLFNLEELKSFELSQFLHDQKARADYVSVVALKDWEQTLRTIVEKAGMSCLKESGFQAEFSETVDTGTVPPKKLSYTEQAARRAECRRLQRFVKLTDYLIVNTLHMLLIESLRDLLQAVYQGCSNTDVAVDTSGLGVLMPEEYVDPVKSTSQLQLDQLVEKSADSRIVVGGAVVGNEVGTDELIDCGFDGFVQILSRIVRANIPQVRLSDAVEEHTTFIPTGMGKTKAKTELAKAAAKDIMREKAPFRPLFRTEFLIQTEDRRDFYFQPSLPDFLVTIDVLFKAYIKILEAFPLLTNTFPFMDPANLSGGSYSSARGLEDSEFTEGPQIGSICMEGGYFREVCGRTRGVFVGMFINAAKWMKSWESIRQMWIEGEVFDVIKGLEAAAGSIAVLLAQADVSNVEGGITTALQAFKENQDLLALQANPAFRAKPQGVLEIASTVTLSDGDSPFYSPLVEFFETCLLKYSSEKQAMESIPVTSIINNVLIDADKLKSLLLPIPERCFSDVAKLLPKVAREKNELLLNEIQTWVRLLNTQPSNVEAFVEYLGWLEKVKTSMPLVEQLNEENSRLYALIEQYRIGIPPTDLALYQTLGPTLRSLKDALDIAVDTKEEKITKFSIDLEKSVSELMSEVLEIRNKAQDPMVLNPASKHETVAEFLEDLREQLTRTETLKKRYETWNQLFKAGGLSSEVGKQPEEVVESGMSDSNTSGELEETRAEVELKRTLWSSLREWESLTETWKSAPFETINTDEINGQINAYMKIVFSLDKGLPPNDVVPRLKGMVEEYRAMYVTIVDLRNPALKTRHWDKVQDTIGKTISREENFTLGKLIEMRVFDFKEEINNISGQAGSESALEEMLTRIVKLWNEAEFVVAPYRDYKDVFILGSVEDIQTLLEDSLVTIATIKGSRFIGPIKTEVDKWDKQINLFAESLDAWLTCQRNWLYLESIFSAPDIQRQLPDEARIFSQVDRSWKDTMRKVARNPNAIKSGTMPGLLELMQQNNVLLDQIQKCLEDYLESKRLLFPRFYFLSNDELLEILSQTRNPQAVQPHLSKCFDAIKSLEFSSNDSKSIDIVAMVSPEGERVPFLKTIKARGNVEGWLGSVEEAMVAVIRRLVKVALQEYEELKRLDWVREHVGQVVLTGNQILWTRDVNDSLKASDTNKSLIHLKNKAIQVLISKIMMTYTK